ncbi:2-dehydro-3-deoxy-D-gluconate 5-dehydrogenase [Tautonia plasticadhaerens]|uniref:2-dehydro-3-deoxy-D-gluconate 5-dehydrogenase n=2 Tax=Tautonia plasticadhaerens TaxID=2527974 RepID=A0A518GYL5_9BACT|nr:2-dehydro-3-deoxy-D-gluconate 5-dehydrogenase [Tautonia plasticadhaerens]
MGGAVAIVGQRIGRRKRGEMMAANPFDLAGKVAIVTGGNGGIGLGMARGLARAGARLALVGRNPEKTAAAASTLAEQAGVDVLPITADVAREDECGRIAGEALGRFGRIDILFNNAGINIRKPPHEVSLDEWREVMDVNLTSAFLLSKAAYPSMKAVGGGKIVNIGSMTSIFGSGFAPAYATSKGGIVQLTKSQALAWAADNIQCNAILPGWFDTELTQKARTEITGLHERVLSRIPAGRWASPDDMAGTAVWLASPASDYVTGVAIAVDGGYAAML